MNTRILSLIYISYLLLKVIPFNLAGTYNSTLSVEMFDVGQGDAILITTPHNKKILVDGGPDYTVDFHMFDEFSFGSACRINLIILTHPHLDHLAGINRLLEHCSVDLVAHNKVEFTSREYDKFLSLIKNLKTTPIYAGHTFIVDKVSIEVLWPTEIFVKNHKTDNLNLYSVVFLLNHKDFKGLFLGDAELEVLNKLNIAVENLDLYKVSHHGSSNGLDTQLVTKLNPRISLISAGANNRYKHPHTDVLTYLESMHTKVFRTDIDGSIEVRHK